MANSILTPEEIKAIHVALEGQIDDVLSASKNQTIPFNPEARQYMREILKASGSALVKIKALTGCTLRMDPYQPGDENEFLTKES